MGKKIIRKRVRIPQYSPSDHTPEFFSDPFAGRLIPTAYFLKELDVLGPQNWMNMLSAEFVLRVVRNSAIHGEADSNDQMECFVDYYENEFSNGSSEDESDMEHDDRVNIDTYEHYSNQRRPQAYSQTHPLLCIPTCSTSATMLPSPPASPMSTQAPYSPSPYSYFIHSPLPSPSLPSEDIFFCHTLILATQSGYFNRLLGPINSPTYTPYSKYASFLASPAPYSPDSQIFALPTITISVPHPSCFPPILHWLYNHDDDEWLDTMTLDNFGRVYENVVFLKLGREAYDVLDQFLEETEDAGIDYEIEGVLEEC